MLLPRLDAAVSILREVFGTAPSPPDGYRRLHAAEVAALERACNSSPAWDLLLVPVEVQGLDRVRGCLFDGRVVLRGFTRDTDIGHGQTLPSGLMNSSFKGCCFLGDDCLIRDTTLVRDVLVGRGVSVIGCGVVMSDGVSSFGNGETVLLGPESGGDRGVPMFLGARYGDLIRAAVDRSDCDFRDELEARSRAVTAQFSLPTSVLCDGVVLSRCGLVRDVFLGPCCVVAASDVECCTFNSTAADPILLSGGCSLHTCVLAGANEIGGPCVVRRSFLLDHAAVSIGANVSNCVIGPDSSVSGAECLHSMIGPFTGIHHSSLVISCTWPVGRGNIAYGAKVGANHTGRLNDQEHLSGEGCFFGLGVQIKYPFNTTQAPYSLFAAGTICLPQRISFPFSLISGPDIASGADAVLSPALNVIRPGWMLLASPYTLVRTEYKINKRRKSEKYSTDHALFRPWIVYAMMQARRTLKGIARSTNEDSDPVYTERDDAGIGKNTLRESDRARGVLAYTVALRKYALEDVCAGMLEAEASEGSTRGKYLSELWNRVVLCSECSWDSLPSMEEAFLNDIHSLYPSEKLTGKNCEMLTKPFLVARILLEEYGNVPVDSLNTWATTMLDDLTVEIETHLTRVSQCRERDLDRGQRIIPDYAVVHGLTAIEHVPSYVGVDPIISVTVRLVQYFKKSIDFLKEVSSHDTS